MTDSLPSTPPPEWVQVLYQIGRQFASSLELDEVLGKVLDLTVQTVGASVGSIFLLDAQGNVQRSILARRHLPPLVKHATVSAVMSRGFAGWVYRHQTAAILANTREDPRWFNFPDDPSSGQAQSAMAAPLIRRGRLIGVITLTHAETHRFTERQLELLEAIADQAASAVENAALYTEVSTDRSLLQAVIAGVQDIIIVTDANDRLILLNPAARIQLALPQAMAGQPFDSIVQDMALLTFYRAVKDQPHSARQMTLADGRVFDCALVQIPLVGRVLGMHDVTAFKQLDMLKSEFVSHVSHDLKAPLAIVHGYAEMLVSTAGVPAEAESFGASIMEAVDRMQSLINSLLDLGQIERGLDDEFEELNLSDVAVTAIDHLRLLASDKNIALTVEALESVSPVRGSMVRLGQAVSNLVSNAIKFTMEGGFVQLRVAEAGGEVRVTVRDTGPGIPPAMLSRLFQKFSRLGLQRGKEGHGLGLSIVKSVVEAHGGRVWVESALGQGSTFGFAVPVFHPE